ncbi:MAG: site-2 protease family protein [Tepidisphaeraceae bacterium]
MSQVINQPASLVTSCPRCGTIFVQDELVCRACGEYRHRERLQHLSDEALRLERFRQPVQAAMVWQKALALLPGDSPEHRQVAERVGMLNGGWGRGAGAAGYPAYGAPPRQAPPAKEDTWAGAVAKTLGSMVLSIAVYAMFLGVPFAAGFVLLILVHELGHVIAMRYYKLRASAPIFIPFLGAVINLRDQPKDAKVEAVVGIGGPVLGTVGALACYGAYLATGSPLLLELSFWGFFLNLFNMLPVPPLDGGRVTAAVSPWIWMIGFLGLLGITVRGMIQGRFSPILLLLIFYAFPRIWRTLTGREHVGEYYNISRATRWMMGALYLGLGGLLVACFFLTERAGGFL